MPSVADYNTNIFINCPFDDQYRPTFYAIVFAIQDAGFRARCALEYGDSSANRWSNITKLIKECKYGVHDISRIEFSKIGKSNLPRFNMPLELGLFLGGKEYGTGMQRDKCCIILDRDLWRYRATISDLAGQDIYSHDGDPHGAIREICKWLSTVSQHGNIPGGILVSKRFRLFQRELPNLCKRVSKTPDEMVFADYANFTAEWLRFNTR